VIRLKKLAFLWMVMLVALATVRAQESDPVFDATEAMIPMRDGVRLYTQIYVPRVTNEPLPFRPSCHAATRVPVAPRATAGSH